MRAWGSSCKRACPAPVATAAVARQGGCCCRQAAESSTFHLHNASRKGGRCTYRLQSGADKVGLGGGRSGGAHDQGATAGHRRLLSAARRQHGSLEHEGSHDFALQQGGGCFYGARHARQQEDSAVQEQRSLLVAAPSAASGARHARQAGRGQPRCRCLAGVWAQCYISR